MFIGVIPSFPAEHRQENWGSNLRPFQGVLFLRRPRKWILGFPFGVAENQAKMGPPKKNQENKDTSVCLRRCLYFPLLVLKGSCDCWTYPMFSPGLKQMEVWKCVNGCFRKVVPVPKEAPGQSSMDCALWHHRKVCFATPCMAEWTTSAYVLEFL